MRIEILNNAVKYYTNNGDGHGLDHIKEVVENLTNLIAIAEKDLGRKFNKELMFTAALYHDAGRMINKKYHHIESAKIVRNEEYLKGIFTNEEIELIAQMCKEHRSSIGKCTTIEAALLNDADSINTLERIVERTIQYNMKHCEDPRPEALYKEVRNHLIEKFGRNGYQKYKTEYANKLVDKEYRYQVIENEDMFIKLYEEVLADIKR